MDDASEQSIPDDGSEDDLSLGPHEDNTTNNEEPTGNQILAEFEGLPTFQPQIPITPNLSVPATNIGSQHAEVTPNSPEKKKRRTVSIMNDDWNKKAVVIFSIDLEHGGPKCGIVQLSCVAYDPFEKRQLGEFNSYVKPPPNASWSEANMEIHNIRPTQARIMSASSLEVVWGQFVEFVESKLNQGSKKGVFVAWNGTSCDIDYFFKVVEISHQGQLFLPRWCPYFCDPGDVIKHYSGCQLNQKHSKIVGYGCAEVWCYVTGKDELPGAHSSLVDAKAQLDIVIDERFMAYINKPDAIVAIADVWKGKRKKAAETEAELTRPVPHGWDDAAGTTWEAPRRRQYEGSEGGGGPYGPTQPVLECKTLPELFLFYVSWTGILSMIARESNRYATKDWVRPTSQADESKEEETDDESDDDDEARQKRKKPKFVSCNARDEGAQHRYDSNKWIPITRGAILIFLAILMFRGAEGSKSAEDYWSESYGMEIAWIRNAMTRDMFRTIRQTLHFVPNDSLPKNKADPRWDPLQKVMPILKEIQKSLQRGWTIGMKICVDESMIKYMGRAITWVQYLPAKPIKHGIKVYALCCAYTGYLFGFEIYTGRDNTEDGSPLGVINRLILACGLAAYSSGRVLYTDNFYTSLEVMTFVWVAYGMLMVGTFSLTKKKSRTAADFPFHRLSKSAIDLTDRGWMRTAVRRIEPPGSPPFTVQVVGTFGVSA